VTRELLHSLKQNFAHQHLTARQYFVPNEDHNFVYKHRELKEGKSRVKVNFTFNLS